MCGKTVPVHAAPRDFGKDFGKSLGMICFAKEKQNCPAKDGKKRAEGIY